MIRFYDKANRKIIGLAPQSEDLIIWFPFGGYDESLTKYGFDDDPLGGYTKEECLDLADEMLARWTAWRRYIQKS